MSVNSNSQSKFPDQALLQFEQFKHLVNMSRCSWLKLVNQGKAPKPFRINRRVTFYRAEDLNRFLTDPVNFQP